MATVGIDLGTTYSAVARVGSLGKPEMVPNRDGEKITPSVVLFQGEMPLVGTMAKRSAATAPLDVVEFVKRQMGDPYWCFETSEGSKYRPEEVSAVILKRLKEDAELVLGEPVTDAVITVPAYFDDVRRRATKQAGEIAGLNVLRVLNEPTAAALAYGLDTEVGGTVLVYDLGGGTFDVTIMRIADAAFEVLGTDGDRNLGGFDWDNALMTWLRTEFKQRGGPDMTDDDHFEAELREKAELAKRSLTSVPKANVVLAAGGVTEIIPVTRDTFEELTQHLLNRSRDLTISLLEEVELTWSQIDHVLLVGGSTRMPMVRAMIESIAGKTADRTINPDEIVALGAAIQAAIEKPEAATPLAGPTPQVKDVTSHGLGVLIFDPATQQQRNSIIIRRNNKVPDSRSETYETVSDGQTEIRVTVTQGDDEDPQYVTHSKDPQVLRIPPYPAGAPIRVTFSYDVDQTVHIEVVDLTTERSLGSFEVDDSANLSAEQVESAHNKLANLEVG